MVLHVQTASCSATMIARHAERHSADSFPGPLGLTDQRAPSIIGRNSMCDRFIGDDDGVVVTHAELIVAVDEVFAVTRRAIASWPDPHAGGSPVDEEYSRLTDPSKWRIIGARADAWLVTLADAGLAMIERDAAVDWKVYPGTVISRTDRVVPHAAGALPLVVARSQIGDVDDAGVTVGVGHPAVVVTRLPYCGCDACDSGSEHELNELDAHLLAIVSGVFRRLSAGDREISVIGDGGWSASGQVPGSDVDAILSEPSGWEEVSGNSWLGSD